MQVCKRDDVRRCELSLLPLDFDHAAFETGGGHQKVTCKGIGEPLSCRSLPWRVVHRDVSDLPVGEKVEVAMRNRLAPALLWVIAVHSEAPTQLLVVHVDLGKFVWQRHIEDPQSHVLLEQIAQIW